MCWLHTGWGYWGTWMCRELLLCLSIQSCCWVFIKKISFKVLSSNVEAWQTTPLLCFKHIFNQDFTVDDPWKQAWQETTWEFILLLRKCLGRINVKAVIDKMATRGRWRWDLRKWRTGPELVLKKMFINLIYSFRCKLSYNNGDICFWKGPVRNISNCLKALEFNSHVLMDMGEIR